MEHPSGINFILNADPKLTENVLMDITEKHPAYTHMALDVNDISSIENKINKLGIHITEGPITLANGGVIFFIRDPDMNVIEFHQNG